MQSPNYQQFKHIGLVLDLPPEEVAEGSWTGGNNIQYQDTATRRADGYAAWAGTPLVDPIFVMSVPTPDAVYWIYCGVSTVFVTDGTTHTDLTPVGGLTACTIGTWTGTILNGIPCLNNPKNPPMYWPISISQKCLVLPGWPSGATCGALRAYRFNLFALRVADPAKLDHSFWWSNSAVPGAIPQEWTPTSTNDAGDRSLADSEGYIVDALPMRDMLIIYKSSSAYAVQYVGGIDVFAHRKLFLNSGLLSVNCVVEAAGYHYLVGNNDVIKHDSQSYVSIVQDKIKHAIFDTLDVTQKDLVCMAYNARSSLLWVCTPTTDNTGLARAFLLSTINDAASIRDLPSASFVSRGVIPSDTVDALTWDTLPYSSWDTWNTPSWDYTPYAAADDKIMMAAPGALYQVSADIPAYNGMPVDAFVDRQSVAINNNILRALVTRIIPRLEGTPGDIVYIRIGTQSYFNDPIAWSAPLPFIIGQNVSVSCQAEGRLISVRFEVNSLNPWKLYSYRLGVVDLGLF